MFEKEDGREATKHTQSLEHYSMFLENVFSSFIGSITQLMLKKIVLKMDISRKSLAGRNI
jgi:hypothetical protein